jgi:2-polyprenyl-3-methyl-5-hydroxy-6-metoxy-1,4-benzoquinol methylase
MLERIFSPNRIARFLAAVSRRLNPEAALRYLFAVDRELYQLEGQASVRHGQGIHSKHRHIHYHQFFIDNLQPGMRVLDVGCGNGVMDRKIAESLDGIRLTGIELNPRNYEWARENSAHPNIEHINADALTYDFGERFDVVTLSNVLEHIEDRVGFLKRLREKCQPAYFLIRVPMFERDWRIPLQAELGINYFLDDTHYIEYRLPQLKDELAQAGLVIDQLQANWGEYWLKATCQG